MRIDRIELCNFGSYVTDEGNGRLRIYDGVSADGDFSEVSPRKYDGFAEIVDVAYKEKVY